MSETDEPVTWAWLETIGIGPHERRADGSTHSRWSGPKSHGEPYNPSAYLLIDCFADGRWMVSGEVWSDPRGLSAQRNTYHPHPDYTPHLCETAEDYEAMCAKLPPDHGWEQVRDRGQFVRLMRRMFGDFAFDRPDLYIPPIR